MDDFAVTLDHLTGFNNVRLCSIYEGEAHVIEEAKAGTVPLVSMSHVNYLISMSHVNYSASKAEHKAQKLFNEGKLLLSLEFCSGCDYSSGSGSVSESNHRSFLAEYKDCPGIITTTGGYGSYGILVVAQCVTEEMLETFAAVENYPLIDDDDHSALVFQRQREWWDGTGAPEFIREVKRHFDFFELDFEYEVDLFSLFSDACAEVSECLVEQDNSQSWFIDMEKVVKAVDVNKLLDLLDTWILNNGITSDTHQMVKNEAEAKGFPCDNDVALKIIQGAWAQLQSDPQDPDPVEVQRIVKGAVFGHFQCYQLSLEVF
jgi:hypothetical protein